MIINSQTQLGGATYPFLHRLGKPWMIHAWHVDDEEVTPYRAPIALRWINGNTVNDLYIENMNTGAFLAATGLRPHMTKGGFVLSKRLSRLMRPYFMYAFFERNEISVRYLEQDARDEKIWDGAGRIRRSVLLRILEQMPDLPASKRAAMAHELRHAQRVEVTMMGSGNWRESKAGGQDKGHVIVFEDEQLEADIVLPRDTKGEITLDDGSIFIGIYPVHHADTMRLDIQSLINLWGFFRHDDLMRWLHEEGEMFLTTTQNGDVARAMRRIDQTDVADDDEALEAIRNWHIREFLASGGDPLWFGSIVKGLINQHLKRINYTTLGRLRLPIPGGRYYVMTDRVGRKPIEPGHVKLDPDTSTAWVNADDWADYQAEVWGGADQDDALWCFPFIDADGSKQILLWRSPNQLGEYILLRPTDDCHIPEWETTHATISYPRADSRNLPTRSDAMNPDYLHLVDPATAGGLGEWLPAYSIDAMSYTVHRARLNRGALGQYCNVLMLAKALYDRLPKHPPAPLEAVIDGSVKTGTDLHPVKEWCYKASRAMVEQGKPVPVLLQDRLSLKDEPGQPTLVPETSDGHWFDTLIEGIEAHITYIEGQRNAIMARTMPPIEVFNAAYQSCDWLRVGARLNQLYTSQLPWAKTRRSVARGSRLEEALDIARQRSTEFLQQASQGDAHNTHLILLAAAAHYYSNPTHTGKDESVWQMGPKAIDGTRLAGIAQQTIQALRYLGILDELTPLANGYIVRYPGARTLVVPRQPIKIVGVWFNYWIFTATKRDLPIPERMRDVDERHEDWAKEQIAALANTRFKGLTLDIRHENGRAIAYTKQGNRFGYVAKEHTTQVPAEITLHVNRVKDGNYLSIYR